MNLQPIPDSLRELFDSCRDEADLRQPEMLSLQTWLTEANLEHEALDAIRERDDWIIAHLNEVPVPAGLPKRVLDRLAADGVRTSVDDRADLGKRTSCVRDDRSQAPRRTAKLGWSWTRRSRRTVWMSAGLVLATVGAAMFVALVWGRFPFAPRNHVSSHDLCVASLAWVQQAELGPWPDHGGPHAIQPIIPKLIGQKRIQTDFGPTECYLVSLPNGSRVYQFVFRVKRSFGLPSSLPARPEFPLQGYACGAYQRGDQVFVVAVEGDAATYRQAVESGMPSS